MNKIIKHILIFGSIVLIFSMIVFIAFKINRHEAKQMRENIGMKIINNGDTLTVISFSTTQNTYMLSNGQSVNYEMIYELNIDGKY